MRNATSILLFGASALGLTLLGACGGGGDGSRDDGASGSGTGVAGSSVGVAGSTVGTAGTGNGTAGATATGGTGAGGSGAGGAPACSPVPGAKKGDGTNLVIDDLDDTNTMFAPAGVGMGSWDWGKDTAATAMGTITPANTMMLAPATGGQMGSALHVTGTGLTGWGASLAAFLNGTTGAFDASAYGGVAFWIKGTTTVQEGTDKILLQARMPDVLPGAGSCCNDTVKGSECYSGHRTVISITAEWTEVKVPWSAFQGPAWGLGASIAFNPNRIRDINFSFNHDTMGTTPASFDVWVDGMRFLAMGEMGNVGGGGTGGTGGTPAGGAAGAAGGAGTPAGGGGAGGSN